MKLLGLLNRIVPESKLKSRLKGIVMDRVVYGLTGKPRSYTLKDGVECQFYPILLMNHSIGNFELIGYEKHYTIQPGDTVIDGGGFQGVFAVYAGKKVGPEGRVICYEPDDALARLIEKNLKLNGLEKTVTVVRRGLWNRSGELAFDTRGNAGNIDFDGERADVLTERVLVASLDEEVERLGLERVDLIKMNIEGAEIEACQGCEKLVQKFSPHFAVASNHTRDGEQTVKKVEPVLAGFGLKTLVDYPEHLSVYAWKE